MRRVLVATLIIEVMLAVSLIFAGSAYANPPTDGPPGQGECEHGNSGQPCRPDPQPSHGADCDEHGPNEGGVNEDHCTGEPSSTPTPSTSPSESPSPTPSVEPSVEPSEAPSVEPSLTPTPVPTVEPSQEPLLTPTVSPSVTPEPTSSVRPPFDQPVVPAQSEPRVTPPPTDTEATTTHFVSDRSIFWFLVFVGINVVLWKARPFQRR